MIGNRDAAFAFTVSPAVEGGLSLDPKDGGNYVSGIPGQGVLIGSNWGISARLLAHYLAPEIVTKLTMAGLPRSTAEAIWSPGFWLTMNCNALPAGLDLMVCDHGYNRGPYASARVLQKLCGAETDGWIGGETVTAAEKWEASVTTWSAASAQVVRRVQIKLGVVADGVAGVKTVRALNAHPAHRAILAMAQLAGAQIADYRTLDEEFIRYGATWTTRVWNRLSAGLALV